MSETVPEWDRDSMIFVDIRDLVGTSNQFRIRETTCDDAISVQTTQSDGICSSIKQWIRQRKMKAQRKRACYSNPNLYLSQERKTSIDTVVLPLPNRKSNKKSSRFFGKVRNLVFCGAY